MRHIAIGLLLIAPVLASAQGNPSQSWTDNDGAKNTIEPQSGWTKTVGATRVTVRDASWFTATCGALQAKPDTFKEPQGEWILITSLCEVWGEEHPPADIERVPFATLITRLFLITPPSTDFRRYRGLPLSPVGKSETYDALIVPSDLGPHVACMILQDDEVSGSPSYQYHCSIKTMSYPAAVALLDALTPSLERSHIAENRIAEHGLAVADKGNAECAPTGECAHAHMFVSDEKENKVLAIQANPDFLRDAALDYLMLTKTGRHNPVISASQNSATLELSIYSFEQDKPNAPPKKPYAR